VPERGQDKPVGRGEQGFNGRGGLREPTHFIFSMQQGNWWIASPSLVKLAVNSLKVAFIWINT
jgi:hypothetical protein